MKKWIFISCGAAVVVIVILLAIGISNLGPMIKYAVNTYCPGITRTEVKLGDVDISLFSGKIKLKDFYLGNPKGFSSPYAVKVKSMDMSMSRRSLSGEVIVINRIKIDSPDISYERLRKTDNFKVILNNIKRFAGSEKTSKKKGDEESSGGKILIRDFIITDGRVNLALSALGGKRISAPLPELHLTNIGGDEGVTAAEAFEEIFSELYKKVVSYAVTETLNQGLKGLGLSLEGKNNGSGKELKAVTDKLKGLFGK
ncbi:MAG: AsmA family protein [Gemmatimonadota bacterium]|nr:AsmA family protein [Gemmatimonadota bacterium]